MNQGTRTGTEQLVAAVDFIYKFCFERTEYPLLWVLVLIMYNVFLSRSDRTGRQSAARTGTW